MKKMIKTLGIGIAVLVVVSYFFESDNKGTNGSNSDQSSANKPAEKASVAYAMRAADNTWPAINEGEVVQVENPTDRNYYLVFDGSASMSDSNCSNGQSKIEVAKAAVVEFLKKIPDNANIGLVIFDGRGNYERSALGKSSKDGAIHQVLQASAGGGTPLKSSIEHAYKSLSLQAVKQLGYGEYHLVVITDGEASDGEEPRYIVQNLLTNSPVVLHTIGFCIKGGHSLNQAGNTFYKSANNPEQLAIGLDSVLAEAPDFKVDTFDGQMQ